MDEGEYQTVMRAVVGALMGAESHPAWAAIVRAVAEGRLPILSLPNEIMPDMSDHRAFRLAQRPFLFVTVAKGRTTTTTATRWRIST